MADSITLKEKGNKAFIARDFQNAISCYTQALQVDPQNHVLYSNRSAAYLQVKEFEKALEDSKKCHALMPTFSKGKLRHGDSLVGLGQFSEAVRIYEECLTATEPDIVKFAEAGIQNVTTKEFYSPIIGPRDLEIAYISETKGKGMFATRDFKRGEIVFEEDALIIATDPECKKTAVCDHCMRFVEPIESQIARSGLKLNSSELEEAMKCDMPKSFLCPECNKVYCSEHCYATAKNLYHAKLCVSTSQQTHPLNSFRKYARAVNYLDSNYSSLPMVQEGPTSTTFSLVERIFAIIATNLENKVKEASTQQASNITVSLPSILGPMQQFQRTSLMKMQPAFTGDNLPLLLSHLQHPLQLLRNALFSDPCIPAHIVQTLITEQLFDELLGLVSINNTSSYVLPPFSLKLNRQDREVAAARSHALVSNIGVPCYHFDESYMSKIDIDETQKKQSRIEELKAKYGFTCICPKCK